MNERLNRVSTAGLVIFSAIPLLTVATAAAAILLSGHLPPPEPDEGTGAHIFQLSIVALVPVGLVFLATSDWAVPSRVLRRSAFPVAAVVLAFVVLYVFEHFLHRA